MSIGIVFHGMVTRYVKNFSLCAQVAGRGRIKLSWLEFLLVFPLVLGIGAMCQLILLISVVFKFLDHYNIKIIKYNKRFDFLFLFY